MNSLGLGRQDSIRNPFNIGVDYIPTGFKDWVVIDQIQKIPTLLNQVHRLIEEKKFKFVLTGSSARKLRRQGVNLLDGRAFTQHAYPLTALELGNQFDLQKVLKTGLLPLSYLDEESKSYLASYIVTYIKEEIQQEGIVRNLDAFTRFLEAATFSQGQVLNLSNVAKDCAVERKSVTNYFSILQDLLLSYQLPVFSLRAKRALISHEKFFFFDCGVFRYLRPRGPLDSESEILGASVETLVLQELMARNEYQNWDYKISYWHTKDHLEVDFVLYGERGFHGIEIKSASRIRDEELKGLLSFGQDYPKAKLWLIYTGKEKKIYKNIQFIPLNDFLTSMDEHV